jgi:CheY-like chemotaxis protein
MARILVIDDEELVRETLEIVLEDAGHQIALAEHGKAGLAKLDQGVFDLVITDLFMPVMEGFETMREIRKRDQDIKIIAISGGGRGAEQELFLEDAQLLGANATLSKPFSNQQLIALIDHLLG